MEALAKAFSPTLRLPKLEIPKALSPPLITARESLLSQDLTGFHADPFRLSLTLSSDIPTSPPGN